MARIDLIFVDLRFIMTAATPKKIAMAMVNAKIEIHMARPPYPSRSTATASTLSSGNRVGCLAISEAPVISSNFGRGLLGDFCELLGLRGHRLELLARMCAR